MIKLRHVVAASFAAGLGLVGATNSGAGVSSFFHAEVRSYEVTHRSVKTRVDDERERVRRRVYKQSKVLMSVDLIRDRESADPLLAPVSIDLGNRNVLDIEEEDLERRDRGEERDPDAPRVRLSSHKNRRLHFRDGFTRARLRYTRKRLRLDLRVRKVQNPDGLGASGEPAEVRIEWNGDACDLLLDLQRRGRERFVLLGQREDT